MRTEQRIPNPAQVARLHDDLCPWLCSSTLPPCAGQACHFFVTLYLGASPFIIYRSRGSRRPSIAALLCSTSINQSINPQLLLLLLLLLLRICVLARPIEQSKMASIWKTKVLPGLTKIFDKDGKKAAAVDFLKSFNKEEIGKEIEDKKTELEPKVVEAYQGSPPEVKALFKDKKPVKVTKKNSAAVTKFLDELAKIEFPGAKLVSEAVAKSGTTPLSPAIAFILGKVAPFIPKEEPKAAAADEATPREVPVEEEEEKKKKEEAEAEAAAAPAASAEPAAAAAEEVVEEKKEAEEKKPAEAAEEEKK